ADCVLDPACGVTTTTIEPPTTSSSTVTATSTTATTTTTTTAVIVILSDYEASGYRYMQVQNGALPGFAEVSFDDSGFSDGTAAFGSPGVCPLVSAGNVHTNWDINTDML